MSIGCKFSRNKPRKLNAYFHCKQKKVPTVFPDGTTRSPHIGVWADGV